MRKKEIIPLEIGPELMEGFENFQHLEMIKNQVEKTNRDERFLSGLANETDGFIERFKNGDREIQIGKAFSTGIEDHVAVQIFLPMDDSVEFFDPVMVNKPKQLKKVKAGEVVHGTPLIAMINDSELKNRIEHGETSNINNQILEKIREKTKDIKAKKALCAVDWGGWGHIPPIAVGRGDILLEAKNHDGVGYEVVFLPAFMGSMDTLNKDLFNKKNNPIWKDLRLGMFTCQLENALKQIANIMDPDVEQIPREQAKLFNWLCGHSMGGYIALVASRFNTGLPLIEAIKARVETVKDDLGNEHKQGPVIISEKPVIVGADISPEDMPPWMKEAVLDEEYEDHVPLQKGIKGWFVKVGVDPIWRNENFGKLREFAMQGALKGFVEWLFDGFLDPDKMMDGVNVLNGHQFSYIRYPDYHRLCVKLLDNARPVADTETLRAASSREWDWLRILFGGDDKILRHRLGELLAEGYQLSPEKVHNHPRGVHHGNWEEWLWMMLQGPFAWKNTKTEKVEV